MQITTAPMSHAAQDISALVLAMMANAVLVIGGQRLAGLVNTRLVDALSGSGLPMHAARKRLLCLTADALAATGGQVIGAVGVIDGGVDGSAWRIADRVDLASGQSWLELERA